jgi:hypothetical protein
MPETFWNPVSWWSWRRIRLVLYLQGLNRPGREFLMFSRADDPWNHEPVPYSHEPKHQPWEKACPAEHCIESRKYRWCEGMRCDVECECHGTGYVPMTTSEMLEALCETGRQDWLTIGIAFGGDGELWVGTDNGPYGDCTSHDGKTFDDALRAALEAVK